MIEYNFNQIIHNVSRKENVENCKLQYKYETRKGDGYMGAIQTARLVGSNKTIHLVFKYRDPESSDGLPLQVAFQNEIYFYKVIFPSFHRFQLKYNVSKPFNNTPVFYGGVDEPRKELLVLEDLKSQHFDLWDRKHVMNEEHLKYAWKTLAKFHGTSFGMKHLDPQLFSNLCKGVNKLDSFNKLMNAMKYYKQVSNMITNMLDIFDPITEQLYHNKFKYFGEHLEDIMPNILNEQDKYDVIAHGDCWCNNTMYQYKDLHDRSVPKDMKLLDFQMARICSPLFDLVYYFYTIASSEILDKLEYFLKYYHNELAQHLKSYNLQIDRVFSSETFLEKWRTNAKYGLITSILIRRLMLVDSQNAPDITKDTDCFLSQIKFNVETEGLYRQQIRMLVIHFVDNSFIKFIRR